LNRVASIILIIALLALGSGAVEYLHNLDHHPHQVAGTTSCDDHSGHDPAPADDKSDCPFHFLLRAPILLTLEAPLLSLDPAPLDTASFIYTPLVSQHTPARIDCRGPPDC
jgi:hypothetical protein